MPAPRGTSGRARAHFSSPLETKTNRTYSDSHLNWREMGVIQAKDLAEDVVV